MHYAIETRGLTKKYGALTAVNSLDLKIKKGELFGLLGPNGAGKTTTISMLSTILEPSNGTATVAGYDISTQQAQVRKAIGIVFQDPSLDEELTAYENLELHGLIYHENPSNLPKRIKEVLELVELWPKKDELVKHFSGGMKRRLEIARGLLHKPDVLFLDEPTLGLDPQTRRNLWEHIKKMNKEQGITMILTTHYLEEADALCNRIAIIDNGKIVAMGTSSELKHLIGGDIISITSSKPCEQAFKKIKGVKTVTRNGDGTTEVTASHGEKIIPQLFKHASVCKAEITSVTLHEPTLEDVFIKLTGKKMREEEGSSKDAARLHYRTISSQKR